MNADEREIGAYEERFPAGTKVRIKSAEVLRRYLRPVWTLHHPLDPGQLEFADKIVTVKAVAFYHGGDALYTLEGLPGTWHEETLVPA